MKKIAVIGFLAVFAYAAFVPPEGMRKFPETSVQFEVSTGNRSYSARLSPVDAGGAADKQSGDEEGDEAGDQASDS